MRNQRLKRILDEENDFNFIPSYKSKYSNLFTYYTKYNIEVHEASNNELFNNDEYKNKYKFYSNQQKKQLTKTIALDYKKNIYIYDLIVRYLIDFCLDKNITYNSKPLINANNRYAIYNFIERYSNIFRFNDS